MKIVLVADIDNLGKKGEVKEVKPGYARNYLIPQGKALADGTPAARALLGRIKAHQAALEKQLDKMADILKKLEQKEIEFKAKVGEKGQLFGAITAQDIARKVNQYLKDQLKEDKVSVDHRKISIEPIKKPGSYQATIQFGPKVEGQLKIVVKGQASKKAYLPVGRQKSKELINKPIQ